MGLCLCGLHGIDLAVFSVLATMLPTAFFAALDRGANAVTAAGSETGSSFVNDVTRGEILKMSRGIAIMLLVV